MPHGKMIPRTVSVRITTAKPDFPSESAITHPFPDTVLLTGESVNGSELNLSDSLYPQMTQKAEIHGGDSWRKLICESSLFGGLDCKLGSPHEPAMTHNSICVRLRNLRIPTAWFRLRACLKSLRWECGRPRPQQCSTNNRPLFLLCPPHDHVAAPEDGRTPSESCLIPMCVFRQALRSR